jgi:hypothetical protein
VRHGRQSPLWVIFDGISGRRRLVDVRFASKVLKQGRARNLAFGGTPMIQIRSAGTMDSGSARFTRVPE